MPVSVITLQETWANNETEMNYFHLPNYTMVYDDSRLSKHGGLITYIHDTFSFETLIDVGFHQNDQWNVIKHNTSKTNFDFPYVRFLSFAPGLILRMKQGQIIPYVEKCIYLGNTLNSSSIEHAMLDSAIIDLNVKKIIHFQNFYLVSLFHCPGYLSHIV